jgi:CHAT domain-containing protein
LLAGFAPEWEFYFGRAPREDAVRRRTAITLAICAWATAAGCRPTVDADVKPGAPAFRSTLLKVGDLPQPACVHSLARWAALDLSCQQQAQGRNRERWEILRRRVGNAAGSRDHQTQLDRALFSALDGAFADAEKTLTRLSEQDGAQPDLLGELAALHLVQARRGAGSAHWRAALALAAEAAETEPSPDLLAVVASACEEMQLRREARAHWQRLKSDPFWRPFVGQALHRLVKPTSEQRWPAVQERIEAAVARGDTTAAVEESLPYPLQTRQWWQDSLLAWTGAEAGSDLQRTAQQALLAVAADRAERTGDDAMLTTGKLVISLDTSRRTALRRGLIAARDASRALQVGTDEGFRKALDGTRLALEQLPEALAALRLEVEVDHQTARMQLWCSGQSSDCQADLHTHFEELMERAEPSWKALRGKIHRQLGVLAVRDARYGSALPEFEHSAALYDEVGEAENRALANGLRAETLQRLGRLDQAWELLAAALSDLPETPTPFRRHSLLYWTTDHLRAAGALPAALLAAREYQLAAGEDQDALSKVEARLQTARCLCDRARPQEALELLEQARQVPGARLVEEPNGRLAVKVELETVLAASFLPDPELLRSTLARLRALRARLSRIEERFDLRQLLVAEGRILRALGEGLQSDLEAQLQELIRQWIDLVDETDSLAILTRDRELFGQLSRLYEAGGDEERAWSTLERGRSAALLRRRSGVDPLRRSPTYSAVQQALRPDEVLLQFATWPGQTLLWHITPHEVRLHKAEINSSAMAEEVTRLRRALAVGDAGALRQIAASLRLQLFGTEGLALPPDAHLLISPDGPLHELPWNVLFDPALSPDSGPAPAAVTLLPSSNLLLEGNRTPLRFDAATPILFIANPSLGASAQGRFPDLDGSQAIRQQLERLFPNTTPRTGERATRAVLQEAGTFPIVHFDVHGLFSEDPATASLVLAPTNTADAVDYLLARDIAKLDLTGVQLVVLAGCDTARGTAAGLGETNSLARAFLAAGAKAVIATLWKVDDQAAAGLLQDFYRQLAAGETAATALATATRQSPTGAFSEEADRRAFQLTGAQL